MSEGVRISGLNEEIARITGSMNAKRGQVKSKCMVISEDLLRKGRANAPVREGTLIDSMTAGVRDHGIGNGMSIIVSAGNTPYANRMHEAHYQARPRSDMIRRISKRTGKSYYTYRRTMKIIGKRTRRTGGVKVTQEYQLHQEGFWVDSAGHKHGRKYLTRALSDNLTRYQNALAALGDRR